MNVPTRVGCQCVSEDTEILTPDGWKTYRDIEKGCIIKTFNLGSGEIENQVVTSVFKKKYKGNMFNLKNRIQDQLISPNHRVVRKLFSSDKYELQPIKKVLELKSPFIIPLSSEPHDHGRRQGLQPAADRCRLHPGGSRRRSTQD